MTEEAGKPLVLIAEDDYVFREELLPEALAPLGVRILKAENVTSAIRTATTGHGPDSDDALDLVVLDMHMPVDDGVAGIEEDGGIQFIEAVTAVAKPPSKGPQGVILRDVTPENGPPPPRHGVGACASHDRRWAVCPVVVFTAHASYRNCVAATKAGAVAYLPKAERELDRLDHEGGIDDLVETCRKLLRERGYSV